VQLKNSDNSEYIQTYLVKNQIVFITEVSTGQGKPALPCILPCPVTEQGREGRTTGQDRTISTCPVNFTYTKFCLEIRALWIVSTM
jgi:hypothetical protein